MDHRTGPAVNQSGPAATGEVHDAVFRLPRGAAARRSAALYADALRYPLAFKRAEWWDKREGALTNPDVDYSDGPAAFACTRNFCSLPVTDAAAIPAQLGRLQRGGTGGK
ncbi:MAG: hypothetical protein JSR47_21205 [Proteobacteria bacterium]|nr:hypothetical protein [Pseudomonadota bacterium]